MNKRSDPRAAMRRLPKFATDGKPVAPGLYWWDTWKAEVAVVKRGRSLFVTPPGGVRVAVTARLAGTLRPVAVQQELRA